MTYAIDDATPTSAPRRVLMVDDIMTASATAVRESDHLGSALETARLHGVQHLVVLDADERFVGLIEAGLTPPQDVRDGSSRDAVRLAQGGSEQGTSIATRTGLLEAEQAMLTAGACSLAVLDDDRHVLGVLTGADLLRAIVNWDTPPPALGLSSKGDAPA